MLRLGDAVLTTLADATPVTVTLPLKSDGQTPQYVYVCHRWVASSVAFVFVKPFSSTETAPADAVLMPVPLVEPALLYTGGCDRIRLRNTDAINAITVTVTALENA